MPQVVRAPGGRQLTAEVTGDPAGEPVFLLHGTPGSLVGPRPRGIFLYRLGIRLISYSRPGYPGSDRLKDRFVADAASDVEAIANHFGIGRFSVIGRSGGAPHALACAADKRLRDRVVCTAALSSLAPRDAEDLDWNDGMAESNRKAYRNAAESDLQALVAAFTPTARQLRDRSQGLLDMLESELARPDREVIGDTALRRIIAHTHAQALSESMDGWIDDVIALGHPWDVDLSEIKSPVLLWHGGDDVFSPVGHTKWLSTKIAHSELRIEENAAHFQAVTILPEILGWVRGQSIVDTRPEFPPPAALSEGKRADQREQSMVEARLGHVGMLSPQHVR